MLTNETRTRAHWQLANCINHAMDYRVLSVRCCVCDILSEFVDVDPSYGRVKGRIAFGPASFLGQPDESEVEEYHIWLVDATLMRLRKLETVEASRALPQEIRQCCSPDRYSVEVETDVPDIGIYRLMVVPVTRNNVDLLLGRTTAPLVDVHGPLQPAPRPAAGLDFRGPGGSGGGDMDQKVDLTGNGYHGLRSFFGLSSVGAAGSNDAGGQRPPGRLAPVFDAARRALLLCSAACAALLVCVVLAKLEGRAPASLANSAGYAALPTADPAAGA